MTAGEAEVHKTQRCSAPGRSAEGVYRVIVPAGGLAEDRAVPPTLEEFKGQLRGGRRHRLRRAFAALAVPLRRRHPAGRALPSGRVLLAGDAAHIHPPVGGQGLNLGVQDAFNLGWKLAAEVDGWAPEGLLDSYHRRAAPGGGRVLDNTRAQTELMSTEPGPQAVRRLVVGADELPGGEPVPDREDHCDRRFATTSARGPELLGRRLRDMKLKQGHLYELLHAGRGLLLDQTGQLSVTGWADRVDQTASRPPIHGDPRPARPSSGQGDAAGLDSPRTLPR